MNKRVYKKLCTDKTYVIKIDYINKCSKNRKLMRTLIKSGGITVSRIDLGYNYREIDLINR